MGIVLAQSRLKRLVREIRFAIRKPFILRYTQLPSSPHFQTSPTSLHPPLQLKLTSPDEPGFRLEKVPVRNMKEVLAILEVLNQLFDTFIV